MVGSADSGAMECRECGALGVGERRRLFVGQALTTGEERTHGPQIRALRSREPCEWRKLGVPEPVKNAAPSGALVDTRWLLSWRTVEGGRDVMARLVAKRYQGPDVVAGLVQTPGRGSLGSPHIQVISLSALQEWNLRRLRNKNALPWAGGLDREVYLRAPPGRGPHRAGRVWRLRVLADGSDGVPAACYATLHG